MILPSDYSMSIDIVGLASTQQGSAMLVMGLFFVAGLIPLIGYMLFKK
ncbi:MAG: hypothetical protein QXY45_04055 [Candidatus Aenigmatarchaeota archaeon]